MTYCGHSVLQTLCRCHFSPASITAQRYIYTGCASGRIVGKSWFFFFFSSKDLFVTLNVSSLRRTDWQDCEGAARSSRNCARRCLASVPSRNYQLIGSIKEKLIFQKGFFFFFFFKWDGYLYRWLYSGRECNRAELEEDTPTTEPVRRSQRIKDRMNRLRAKLLLSSEIGVDTQF